jgi:hypothetical protein
MNIKVTYKDGTSAFGEEISHYPSAVVECNSLAAGYNVDHVEIVRTTPNLREALHGESVWEVLYYVDGVWK